MKKRILALILAMGMTLGLAACGGDSSSAGSAGSSSGDASTAAPSDFKVGAIYINSRSDTAGYTYAHHHGITTAMEELGLDPDTQLAIQDNVAEDYDAVSTAVDNLVGEGCDIIFGISFGYMQAMADKAEEWPDVIFSHATGYMSNETNFNNYFGRAYQARYLAGIAAGLKSLETGNNNIGFVAAYGRQYAETSSGINGFALGVQAVNPDATVYVKELGAWADEVNESAFAKELIQSFGCGVISQHCDSAQPQIAAQDAGVFGCGYNSDMTADAPQAHLTAAIWNWNVYYHTAIEAAMTCGGAENFVDAMGGQAYYGGLKENFVGVSPDRLRRVGRVHRHQAAHHHQRGRHRQHRAGGGPPDDRRQGAGGRRGGGRRARGDRGRRRPLRGGLRHHWHHELLCRWRGGRQLRRFPNRATINCPGRPEIRPARVLILKKRVG